MDSTCTGRIDGWDFILGEIEEGIDQGVIIL
jgi:hypothetical protein